jgi:hypothetical protein
MKRVDGRHDPDVELRSAPRTWEEGQERWRRLEGPEVKR